ncbi:hypothetical protein [uncultured Cetobacterium sp.]|uniref:hypothetical protein n=1 Tax=uncultured Cetobacterium sp. TaxID=527638 RepID=UPI002622A677|nr:hypothetical protein [uncultured Cetobacterium sp.]
MKKKLLIPFSIIIGIFIALILIKDFSLKYLIEKEASKALNEKVSISYAHLNILSQDITLTDLNLPKEKIFVNKIKLDFNIFDILNKKQINIKNLNIEKISFVENKNKNEDIKIISKKQNKTNNNKVSNVFFSQLTKEVALENNISDIFSGNFSSKTVTKNLSNNFFNFLIKNTDYVDIILEKQLNKKIKNNLMEFNEKYLNLISKLEKLKNQTPPKYQLNINNINFSGDINSIQFNGNIKNISNDFNKSISIPLTINFNQNENSGKLYGDFNIYTLVGKFYLDIPNINLTKLNISKNFIKQGSLSIKQNISINNRNINITGDTKVSNLLLNKEVLINSIDTTSLNRELLLKILDFVDLNITSFSGNTNYSNQNNFISLKTSLPEQLKGILIRNKEILHSDISKTIENHYKDVIQEKKNSINNFLNKFKDIF